jgi:hypothetical protein
MPSALRSFWCCALLISLLAIPAAAHAQLPAQLTSVAGGSGGTAFTRDCGSGKVLTGLRGREGLQIDAIGVMCAPVLSDGTLGPSSATGTLTGGTGGQFKEVRCANGSVVSHLSVNYGTILNDVMIDCKVWNASTRQFGGTSVYIGEFGATRTQDHYISLSCDAKTQPAAGIRGRSGILVDAIGLICDEP